MSEVVKKLENADAMRGLYKDIWEDCLHNSGEIKHDHPALNDASDFYAIMKIWLEKFKEELAGKGLEGYYRDLKIYYDLFLSKLRNKCSEKINWCEVWNKMEVEFFKIEDKRILECLIRFIGGIRKSREVREGIDEDSFVKKLKSVDNISLVYLLYLIYFDESVFNSRYTEYLDEYVIRNNSTYEDCFKRLYNDMCINNMPVNIDYIGFDRVLEVNPHVTFLNLVRLFSTKINLNIRLKVKNEDSEKSLKDMIIGLIGSYQIHKLKDSNLEYNSAFSLLEKCALLISFGKKEEANKLFETEECQLYSDGYLKALNDYQAGCLSDEDLTPEDNLYDFINIFPSNQNDCLNLLYSDKIKMISYNCIMLIKERLKPEEFDVFIQNITTRQIPIYYFKDGKLVFVSWDEISDYGSSKPTGKQKVYVRESHG